MRTVLFTKPVILIIASALLVAIACACDDKHRDPAAADKGGGAGSNAGSGGKSGASGAAGLAGEGGQFGPTASDVERAREMCSGSCAIRDFVYLTGIYCEPGSRLHYNDVIAPGEGGAPASEAPQSKNEACIDGCTDRIWSGHYGCWQAGLAMTTCFAEGVWDCDEFGNWGSPDCFPYWPEGSQCPE